MTFQRKYFWPAFVLAAYFSPKYTRCFVRHCLDIDNRAFIMGTVFCVYVGIMLLGLYLCFPVNFERKQAEQP
jgi:hypothetical protein